MKYSVLMQAGDFSIAFVTTWNKWFIGASYESHENYSSYRGAVLQLGPFSIHFILHSS